MKVVDQLTLSNFRKGRPVKFSTDLEINILKVTDLHGLVKLFSRTLTGFLRVQTSEFEMPTMELHGLVKLFSRTLTGFLRVQTSEFEMPTME
jgi:hypothetical protein